MAVFDGPKAVRELLRFLFDANVGTSFGCPFRPTYPKVWILAIIPFGYSETPSFCAFMVVATALVQATHVTLANGTLRLSARALKCLFSFYYIQMSACILLGLSLDTAAATHDKLMALGQFVCIVLFVDSSVHIPGQLGICVTEILRLGMSKGWNNQIIDAVGAQVVFSGVLITSSVALEYTVRQSLQAQQKYSDAESLVASFRTVLGGTCDADLLLNGALQIQDGGEALCHALSLGDSLKGKQFTDLLVRDTDELERFHAFIAAGTTAKSPAKCATPRGLRVSLCTAHAERIGADVFHVCVAGIFGSRDPHHVLALKFDGEASDASVQSTSPVPAGPVHPRTPSLEETTRATETHNSPSERSVESRAAGSFLSGLEGFTEVSFLVNTQNLEVISAHFNFAQESGSSTGPTQPAIRKFVRATQWPGQSLNAQVAFQVVAAVPRSLLRLLQNCGLGKSLCVEEGHVGTPRGLVRTSSP